jgi:outer membrane beta-barrel protein
MSLSPRHRTWFTKFSLLLLVAAATVWSVTTRADNGGRVPEGDEYDFSWLDPDKKVYIIQNRKYRKAMRPSVYAGGGLNLSNSFRTAYLGMVKPGFWINEQFGVEGVLAFHSNSDNATLTALKRQTTVLPYVREIRSYFAANFVWAPFYSKLNIFNYILYMDWMISAGMGSVNSANDRNTVAGAGSNFQTQSHIGIFMGTAMNFYMSKNFFVRLDLQGVNYGATGADDRSRRFQSFDFTTGLGVIF